MRGLVSDLKVKRSLNWRTGVLLKVFTWRLEVWLKRLSYSSFPPLEPCWLWFPRGSHYSHCIFWAPLLSSSVWVWPVGDTCRRTECWKREREWKRGAGWGRELFPSCFLPALVYRYSRFEVAPPPAGSTFVLLAPSDLLMVLSSHCHKSLATSTPLLAPLTMPSSP